MTVEGICLFSVYPSNMKLLLKKIKFEDSAFFSCISRKRVQIFIVQKNKNQINQDGDNRRVLYNFSVYTGNAIINLFIDTDQTDNLPVRASKELSLGDSSKKVDTSRMEEPILSREGPNNAIEEKMTMNNPNHITNENMVSESSNNTTDGTKSRHTTGSQAEISTTKGHTNEKDAAQKKSDNEQIETDSKIIHFAGNLSQNELERETEQTFHVKYGSKDEIADLDPNKSPISNIIQSSGIRDVLLSKNSTDKSQNESIVLEIFKNGKKIASSEFLKDQNKSSLKSKKLKFSVLYEYLERDTFSFMDNSEIEGPLTSSAVSFASYEVRKYKDSLYTVENSCLSTDWTKNPSDTPISINHGGGWEEIRMENGVFFWVNHPFQVILPPGKTQYMYEEELSKKLDSFLLILEQIDTFKYLIFTKFTLFTQRYNFIQSSASYFLRVGPDFIRRSLRIKIKDEIGEDEGGIRNEFFSEVAYEIANDHRMLFVGDFLDVNPSIYDDVGIPDKKPIWRREATAMEDQTTENSEKNCVSDSTHDEINFKSYGLGEPFIQRKIPRKPVNEFDPLQLWNKSDFELDQDEMCMLRRKFASGLSFSKITNIKSGATLKFWHTTEKKNKRFIEDTDPNFFSSKNVGKNLLSNDEFYAYVGVFLALSILHQETMSVKFSLSFIENLFGGNMDLTHVQDLEVQKNLLHILRTDLDDEYLDLIDDPLLRIDKFAYVSSQIHENRFFSKKRAYDIIYYFFYSVISQKFIKTYLAQDIYFLLNGIEAITFDYFVKSLYLTNTKVKSIEITYLFNILKRKDEVYYRKFLKFVTGSEVISLKKENNNDNRIFIEQDSDKNALFRASSCVKILFIGVYDTEEDMERIMDFSILNTEGFHKI